MYLLFPSPEQDFQNANPEINIVKGGLNKLCRSCRGQIALFAVQPGAQRGGQS